MSVISRLKVWIGSDTSALDKGLQKSKKEVSAFGKGMQKIGSMIAGAFALSSLKNFAQESIALAKIQADAEKKLEAVLKATGNAAGLSAKELKKYASQLQDVTLYGDEATIAAMGMMASFKSIKGDIFKEAIKAAQDMSTVMNTDLKQSVLQLGKALESPEIGMSALRETGVSFTQEQIAGVKKLIAEGKKQEAQMIILKELQGEFGGAAKAAANDAYGAMTQLSNAWGDFKEAIGQAITPGKEQVSAFTSYVQGLTNVVQDEAIPAWKKFFGLLNPINNLNNINAAGRNKAKGEENDDIISSLKLREKELSALMELYSTYSKYNKEKKGWYDQTVEAIKAEMRLRTQGVAAITAAEEERRRAEAEQKKAEEDRKARVAEVLGMEEQTLTAIAAKIKAVQGLRDAVTVTDTASLDYYNKEISRLQMISDKIDQLSQKRLTDAAKKRDGGIVQTRDVYGGLQGAVSDIGLNTVVNDLSILPDKIDLSIGKLQELQDGFIDFGPIFEDSLERIAVGFGELFGSLASGGNLLDGFAKLVGGTFADMAIQVGKIAISTGIAIASIKLALSSLNPFAAIAAGVALVALGSAVKGALSNAAGSGGGMSYAANSGNTVNIGSTRDLSTQVETRKMQVQVTGELKARGSSLVAVIDAENNRKNLTT